MRLPQTVIQDGKSGERLRTLSFTDPKTSVFYMIHAKYPFFLKIRLTKNGSVLN